MTVKQKTERLEEAIERANFGIYLLMKENPKLMREFYEVVSMDILIKHKKNETLQNRNMDASKRRLFVHKPSNRKRKQC